MALSDLPDRVRILLVELVWFFLSRWSWFGFFFLMYHCIYGHLTFSLLRLTNMKDYEIAEG